MKTTYYIIDGAFTDDAELASRQMNMYIGEPEIKYIRHEVGKRLVSMIWSEYAWNHMPKAAKEITIEFAKEKGLEIRREEHEKIE